MKIIWGSFTANSLSKSNHLSMRYRNLVSHLLVTKEQYH